MPAPPALRTMRILWFALLTGSILYVGIAMSGIFPPPTTKPAPQLPMGFGLWALIAAVASFLLPRRVYANAAKTAVGDVEIVEEAPSEAFSGQYREAMAKRRIFADPAKAQQKAYASSMSPFILSIALSEVISILGFVLVRIGFEATLAAPFFAAGTLLIAIRFPSPKPILEAFEKAAGAEFPNRG